MARNIEDEAELIADNIECATQRRWTSEDERNTTVLNIKAGLERQLAAKDAEIKRLRAACEKVVEQYNVIEFDVDMSNWIEAVVLYDKAMLALKLALAATSGGEGDNPCTSK